MPPPAKRVKATTYRRDSPEVAKLCFWLIAETDARSVGDSHPSCSYTFLRDVISKTHVNHTGMAIVSLGFIMFMQWQHQPTA